MGLGHCYTSHRAEVESGMFRSLWALVVCVVSTLALGITATVVSMVYPQSHMTMRLAKLWSWLMLRAAGIRTSHEGLEHARHTIPCVYIANHQSAFDVWVTGLVLPVSTLYVAKQSIFRIPVLGWAIRAAGFISIDRSNRVRAVQSLEKAVERIRAGRPVLMFAEGTRSRDGRMGSFKKGAFHLALHAGVPVVPVAISGSWKILPPGSLLLRPGPIRVSFAPPLDVAPFQPDDVNGLMTAVRQAIVERLDPAEIGPPPVAVTAGTR